MALPFPPAQGVGEGFLFPSASPAVAQAYFTSPGIDSFREPGPGTARLKGVCQTGTNLLEEGISK